MTKTNFFKKYGHLLVQVSIDDAEYGDFLILHPEEKALAKELEDRGMTIVSVYETESGEDYIDFENPFDSADQPFKYGYLAIDESNKEFL
jgi:hypothetical protein